MAFNKSKTMETARKYVDRGHTDRAIKEYLRVVNHDPNDVRVWLKVGDLYAKKGAKKDATETYLKVAQYYSEQGFYLKAVAVYKQILKLDSRLVEVNLKLADLYRQLGLLTDAMHHFETVASHFHREGKTQEALATIRQLVELDPENIATRIKLAELYSKEQMKQEAITEFGHVCEYLRSRDREEDFIKVAERLVWHKPEDVELNRELATLYLKRDDARRALQKLQVCFKTDQRDTKTLELLAKAFEALGQKPKAVSVLKELVKVHEEEGDNARARQVYQNILRYAPDDPDAKAYLEAVKQSPKPPSRPPAIPPQAPPARPPRALTLGSVSKRNPGSMVTGSIPLVEGSPLPVGSAKRNEDSFAADLSLEDEIHIDSGSVAGEEHQQEIAKILSETEVYVKYGLHQKAIDHLQGVFELDPVNTDAREQLKDIYVSQHRTGEAINELMQLARQVVTTHPSRAEAWLQELLQLEGDYQPAFELARKHQLKISSPAGESQDAGEKDFRADWTLAGSRELDLNDEDMEEFDLDDLSAELIPPDELEETHQVVVEDDGVSLARETQEVSIEQVEDEVQSRREPIVFDKVDGLLPFDEISEQVPATSSVSKPAFTTEPPTEDKPLFVGEPLLDEGHIDSEF